MSGLPDSEVKNERSSHSFNFIIKGTLSAVLFAAPHKCCLDNYFHCLRKSPSDAPIGSQNFQFIKREYVKGGRERHTHVLHEEFFSL